MGSLSLPKPANGPGPGIGVGGHVGWFSAGTQAPRPPDIHLVHDREIFHNFIARGRGLLATTVIHTSYQRCGLTLVSPPSMCRSRAANAEEGLL